eukprot:6200281-Pleurochrysis_carterae.AAC.2
MERDAQRERSGPSCACAHVILASTREHIGQSNPLREELQRRAATIRERALPSSSGTADTFCNKCERQETDRSRVGRALMARLRSLLRSSSSCALSHSPRFSRYRPKRMMGERACGSRCARS